MKTPFMKVCIVVLLAPVFWSATGSASAVVSGQAQAQQMKLPLPEVETLPNGLELIWFVNDKLPVVDLMMTFKSGAIDDPSGKSGTAELLAASLDRGAGGMSAREIARQVESLGASRYASAEMDFFRVGMHGLAPDAETFLDLIAKLVLRPDFPVAEVKREQARMLDGWSRLADYGSSLAELAYRRSLSAGTPYGRGAFLSGREFSRLDREDVVAFHRRHFTPKNAVFMIVGRVNKTKFRSRIESLFGEWKGEAPRKERKNHRAIRPPASGNEVLLVDRPDLTQAQVKIGFRAPLATDPSYYPLSVANALLGEYFHSRLNTLIRDKLGLTYGIGSAFSYNLGAASFDIGSSTRNESVGQLVSKTLGVLRDLKRGPLPDEEVIQAKEYLIGGFPLSTATLESVAHRWLISHLFGFGPNRLNDYVGNISRIGPTDVVRAVGEVFGSKDLKIVVAGDAKAIEPHLRKSGFTVRRMAPAHLLNPEKL